MGRSELTGRGTMGSRTPVCPSTPLSCCSLSVLLHWPHAQSHSSVAFSEVGPGFASATPKKRIPTKLLGEPVLDAPSPRKVSMAQMQPASHDPRRFVFLSGSRLSQSGQGSQAVHLHIDHRGHPAPGCHWAGGAREWAQPLVQGEPGTGRGGRQP